MQINIWGFMIIALYILGKYGFKFYLLAKIGGLIKKVKQEVGVNAQVQALRDDNGQ